MTQRSAIRRLPTLVTLVALVAIGAVALNCGRVTASNAKDHRPAIEGTWRVHHYVVWDSAGRPQQLLGAAPSGYISFDAGRALIQLMQPGNVATFGAYYGTYTVNHAARTIDIRVEGTNIPSYLGTVQTRPFVLRGDTMVLGVEREYQATLVRARK